MFSITFISSDPSRLQTNTLLHVVISTGTVNAWVLYISTDYVFDGKAPPYSTNAQTNPLNSYGESKLAGEVATLEVNSGTVDRASVYTRFVD